MELVLLVMVGAFAGAVARFFVVERAIQRFGAAFPYGTLIVNLSGSLALGIIATLIAERYGGDRAASVLLATGFLGAYTTYSSFSFETIRLLESGDGRGALINVLASTGGGIALASVGVMLTLAVI